MAYESKIIIANVHREKNEKSEDFGKAYYAEIVAVFNMAAMGYNNGWRELFDKEIDFDLFVEDGDNETRTDKYGTVMQEGDREAIIDWLENTAPAFWENNPYRRIAPLLGALKGIEPTQWDELHIVHYGY